MILNDNPKNLIIDEPIEWTNDEYDRIIDILNGKTEPTNATAWYGNQPPLPLIYESEDISKDA